MQSRQELVRHLASRLRRAAYRLVAPPVRPSERPVGTDLLATLENLIDQIARMVALGVGVDFLRLVRRQVEDREVPNRKALEDLAAEFRAEQDHADEEIPRWRGLIVDRLQTILELPSGSPSRGDGRPLAVTILEQVKQLAVYSAEAAAAWTAGNSVVLEMYPLREHEVAEFAIGLGRYGWKADGDLGELRAQTGVWIEILGGAEDSRIKEAGEALTSGSVALAQVRAREYLRTVLARIWAALQLAMAPAGTPVRPPTEYLALLDRIGAVEREHHPFPVAYGPVDVHGQLGEPLRTLLGLSV
jgi:hypothetical protein